jgi:SEC-C motif-containing protein
MDTECPCGSGTPYVACCGPFHGGVPAPTAAQLMRSRYCAFVLGDAAYLLATWDPAMRPTSMEFDPAVQWRRLRIRGMTGGGEADATGTVEFVAHFWNAARGQYGRQHENSRFVRQGRRWFYVDAAPD